MSKSIIFSAFRKILNASVSVSDLQKISKEIDKFFHGMEVPTFKIVNSTLPKWLGQCVTKKKGDVIESHIEIQKSVLDDKETLHRIISHELIHYY